MATIHALKVDNKWLSALWSRKKTSEVRKNDRNFLVGDYLVMEAVDNDAGNGWRECEFVAQIRHIITHDEFPEGIAPGYCVLSINKVKDEERRALAAIFHKEKQQVYS